MKIGVIGTINRDSVLLPDGSRREGWGGILYNLVTLSRSLRNRHEIVPLCHVGADCFKPVFNILTRLKNVNTTLVKKVPERNNHCFLTYSDYENKREILKGGVPALKFVDIEPLLDSDIILLNYISGHDINLRSLRKLRRLFRGKIYIDIHSLTLGKKADGSRYLRYPKSTPEVIAAGDIIQINRTELAVLTRTKILPIATKDIIQTRLNHLIASLSSESNTSVPIDFVVTDGSRGCYLSYYRNNRRIFRHIPAGHTLTEGNTTGCGDCFSAGYIAGLVDNKNPLECARMANSAAAARIGDKGNIYGILDS